MTLIIAHRGSSGNLPENTLEAFNLSLEQNANGIELDLVVTKDKHLIIRHDVFLSRSTNVATLEKFAIKKSTKSIDGVLIEDWFVIDFTLEEIKELKCTQPYLDRPQQDNFKFTIPTLQEVVQLIKTHNKKNKVDLFIEIKNSTFHSLNGINLENLLIVFLNKENLNKTSFVKIMSFEVSCLQYLRKHIKNEIFQLFEEFDIETNSFLTPYDISLQKDKYSYKEMFNKNGLEKIKEYANGICLWKGYLLDKSYEINKENRKLFEFFKELNFKVFIWTLSNKKILKHSKSLLEEYSSFFYSGVDGIITDYPEIANQIEK